MGMVVPINAISESQQSPRQTLFGGVGQVIDEVTLIAEALAQQINRKHFPEARLLAQNADQGRSGHPDKRAVGQCRGASRAQFRDQ